MLFFFFQQKTAYEMRISDWSSDVCSSDLREPGDILLVACYELGHQPLAVAWPAAFLERAGYRPALMDISVEPVDMQKLARARVEIGRASGRERVWQYV